MTGANHFDVIPAALRSLPRWVAWRGVPPKKPGDKFGKQPINPHSGKLASTTNEATWGTFDQALARSQQDHLAGVGFVFTAKDQLVGIDLDHCRNPDTGVVAPWAQAIIDRIKTYTEVSPSGTGVHLIARGVLPPGGRKKDKVEIYCDGRFFTMTGHVVEGLPRDLNERSEEIAALHREVFGAGGATDKSSHTTTSGSKIDDAEALKAAEVEFGDAFRTLWRGDHSSYPSQSEGDLALCGMLARVTNGDRDAIDRLFRRSGLMREKWDSGRGKSTYGATTIQKAIKSMSDAASEGDDGGDKSNTIAQQLLQICDHADVELFHDDRQEAFATITVGESRRTYRTRDQQFRRWLSHEFYKLTGRVASSTPLNDTCNLLAGRAVLDGPCRAVYVRIGEFNGAVYLDLGNNDFSVVEITRDGWKLLARAPIPFRRPPGMRPLPTPIPGGSINALRPFVNCTDEDWPLVLAWLIAAFRVLGPFAILVLLGEHGSAKSTLARVLKWLIDPNAANLRSEPADARDLMIGASNSWILAFDNLSYLKHWFSDALCRLATGGGFTTRSLFTNDEEAIFDSMRPQILNGIEDIVGRSDLLDRCVVVEAPQIPKKKRKAEKHFWATFDEIRPSILGALLDAVSVGLRREADVQLESPPRLADFARWVVACEPGLGLEPGAFLAAYERNREGQIDVSIESCVAAQAVRVLIDSTGPFEGTATELLQLLTSRLGDPAKPPEGWPKTGGKLSGLLRRAAPDLRSVGINIEFVREAGAKRSRKIRINRIDEDSADGLPKSETHRDSAGGPDPGSEGPSAVPESAPPRPESPCPRCGGHRFWWLPTHPKWTCWICSDPPGYIDIAVFDVPPEAA